MFRGKSRQPAVAPELRESQLLFFVTDAAAPTRAVMAHSADLESIERVARATNDGTRAVSVIVDGVRVAAAACPTDGTDAKRGGGEEEHTEATAKATTRGHAEVDLTVMDTHSHPTCTV